MPRSKVLAFLLCMFAILNSQCCDAGTESVPSIDLEISAVSKYVWRGLVCNEDPVVQPSLTLGWQSGLSVNLWGSVDMTDFAGVKGKCSELDLTLGYEWESGGREWRVAYAAYTYPNTPYASTGELSVSCDLGGPFNLGLYLSRDVDEAGGTYLSLAWLRKASLGSAVLDISGGLGIADKKHSDYYFGVPSAGLADASVSLELPFEAGGGWSVYPSITFSSVLDRHLRRSLSRPDNIAFEVTLSRTL